VVSHLLHVSYSLRSEYYISQHKWMCRCTSIMSFRVYRISRSTRTRRGNYPKMALHGLAGFYRVWMERSCSHPFVLPTAWSVNVSWQLGTTLFTLPTLATSYCKFLLSAGRSFGTFHLLAGLKSPNLLTHGTKRCGHLKFAFDSFLI
jgi:hypothetical protein